MKDFLPKLLLIAFLHLTANQSVKAQDSSVRFDQTLSVGLWGHYGFIDPNLPDLAYVLDSRPFLTEITLSSQTIGKKQWQQVNGYPELGVSFLYGNSGSKEYIGHVSAIVPFIEFFPYRSSRFYTGIRIGMGAAWVEKVFNPLTNYKNLIIGSHLNFCADLMVSAGILLFPRTWLDLGVSLTHISNGSVKLPNYGLNPIALSAGITYDLHPPLTMIRKPIPPFKKKWNYYLYTFAAFKEAAPLESPVYLVNVLSLEAMKDFSYTGRFGGGISLTYDRTLTNEIYNSPTFQWDGSKLKLEVGLYLSYEYVAGNLSFPIQLGCYVYNNYLSSSFYEEVGIRYRISNHWILGGAVKAYLGHGDFIDWGLGYKF
ncbi:MAG TPA: acyloxyacyl hydrolase [Puia sp.]